MVISSLGGRWPKKLRSLDGLFAAAGLKRPEVGEGVSNALSGSETPRPLKMLIELARFVFLEVASDDGLPRPSARGIFRRTKPYSRVG